MIGYLHVPKSEQNNFMTAQTVPSLDILAACVLCKSILNSVLADGCGDVAGSSHQCGGVSSTSLLNAALTYNCHCSVLRISKIALSR